VTYVSHNRGDGSAFADLWLMTQCRHFITANSSFSWWGAWLAAPSDTIRPRQGRMRFAGPVTILSSPRTAGAAEDLLVAFRNGSRGPIIGETSAGSTGQTLLLPLRRGWEFRVTVTRDAFPDGTEFARTGVVPEVPVTVRVEDVLAGRDVALDRDHIEAAILAFEPVRQEEEIGGPIGCFVKTRWMRRKSCRIATATMTAIAASSTL